MAAAPAGAQGGPESDRPWRHRFAARLAEVAPLDPAARILRLDAWARAEGLACGSGRPLRFVAAPDAAGTAPAALRVAYERRVFDTGEVATRTDPGGHLHDLYNALMWFAWPRSKARLNALHVATSAAPGAPRGALRDALTLLDENGALWLSSDGTLDDALRAFDWRTLFVVRRAELAARVDVRLFGHALLQRLDAPYKALTAHAWLLRLPPRASDRDADAALCDALHDPAIEPSMLAPLPVLGLPGWCDANRDAAFYNDPQVFRAGRRRDAAVR